MVAIDFAAGFWFLKLAGMAFLGTDTWVLIGAQALVVTSKNTTAKEGNFLHIVFGIKGFS